MRAPEPLRHRDFRSVWLAGLVSDTGALAWALRGRWQCAHCGNRPGPFSWRCGQCQRWNTLRMEEAVRQLQWSQEPLISVACNLGFTTQGNFSRFFRDHVGVPPTLYREAARATA